MRVTFELCGRRRDKGEGGREDGGSTYFVIYLVFIEYCPKECHLKIK
jgi:hypothetical protein